MSLVIPPRNFSTRSLILFVCTANVWSPTSPPTVLDSLTSCMSGSFADVESTLSAHESSSDVSASVCVSALSTASVLTHDVAADESSFAAVVSSISSVLVVELFCARLFCVGELLQPLPGGARIVLHHQVLIESHPLIPVYLNVYLLPQQH